MAFTTPHGITIPFPERLAEGYEIRPRTNRVDAFRLADVFRDLVQLVPEPGFLVLEKLCNEVIEMELRKTDEDPFHRDVYFLDGLDRSRFLGIFTEYADLLVHDGFVHFGFGSHDTSQFSEVFVGDFKVISIFVDEPSSFENKLAEWGIPRFEKLLTARDTFTEDNPGYKNRWSRGDFDIYAMMEILIRQHGLYHAKIIED